MVGNLVIINYRNAIINWIYKYLAQSIKSLNLDFKNENAYKNVTIKSKKLKRKKIIETIKFQIILNKVKNIY